MNDQRLLACAKLCKKCSGVSVDVGTDHGYLAVYLVKQGISDRVVACDINDKPLASARENIRKAGLVDKITTVISDGLDNVDHKNVGNVIIAGMGGELIADIISRADWLKTHKVNLVLQPMTKWDHLRKFLAENNFAVTDELPCVDSKFTYSVIQAVYQSNFKAPKLTLAYLFGGLVSGNTEEGRAYLRRQAKRLSAVGEGISHDPEKAGESKNYLSAAAELLSRADRGDR